MPSLPGDGKLNKMLITAYEPSSAGGPSVLSSESYEAWVNPECFKIDYAVQYANRRIQGKSGTEPRYAQTVPPKYHFELWFDSTIATAEAASPLSNAMDVLKELKTFNSLVYDFDGDRHSPKRVHICYGTIEMDAVLVEMNIEMKLFDKSGNPIRAIAKVKFQEAISNQQRESRDKTNSPDLTHLRIVEVGDTLPLMADRIYGDASLYLEVARVNNLTNFRTLKPGSQLFFPPINKTAK